MSSDERVEPSAAESPLADPTSVSTAEVRVVEWRPPVWVWVWLASEFQPGLTDALSEEAAKVALAAGVAEMNGNVGELGPFWGDMQRSLVYWKSEQVMGRAHAQGVLTVNMSGLPRYLFLSEIGLRGSLSAQLCRLTSLTRLYLDYNGLTLLPHAIGRLTSLTHLSLIYNRLTALPDAIGHLADLEELVLSRNQLTALPETIGGLTKLKVLSLDYNQFTALPAAVRLLMSLTHLDLRDNHFDEHEKSLILRRKEFCLPHCKLEL